MACYHPITGWRGRVAGPSGKFPIVFDRSDSNGQEVPLPCGQCIGCRLERSRQWAMRCVHEASLYESNCFITLTYDNEHLPVDGSLNKRHFQLFMKRLRKRFEETRIRYYHCGEYGERFRRPHYHACLFNFDFLDKTLFRESDTTPLYTSDVLEEVWGLGFCTIGNVSFESAAYVARYIMKKVTGDLAEDHYLTAPDEDGVVHKLVPEYTTMSRRPGIAREWYERFKSEVYPNDSVVIRGRLMKPPRYYDTIFEIEDPEAYALLKRERIRDAIQRKEDVTPERLLVREKCVEARQSRVLRSYENEA